jgi:hypothetical protein
VTLADPAVGTGTFLLGVLRRIAATVEKAIRGRGRCPAPSRPRCQRLIGFEMQFGPFAVAQLRLLAECRADGSGVWPTGACRPPALFITDTLGNPLVEDGQAAARLDAGRSRSRGAMRTDQARASRSPS